MASSSCPNCEYERGKLGRPVVQGDRIHCLDCGTSWKDVSAHEAPFVTDNYREKILAELRSDLRKKDKPGSSTNQKNDSIDFANERSRNIRPVLAASAVAVLLGFGGLLTYLLTHSVELATPKKIVSLSEVEFQEQIGRAGKKVITVRGVVQNRTDQHQALRPIAIILRRKDGGEIVRWRHVSHKPVLKAGGKSRFASSIQYDTPIIAHAEAVFE